MSPEERQLLSDLFERVRSQANAPRDRDAENFIADAVRQQPYAPYLLAQAVIVQEQALHAADQKLQDLQGQVSHLQAEAQAQAERPSSGGFLSGLFGGGAPAPRQAPPQPNQSPNPWGAPPQQQAYAPPPPQGGPWGQPPAQGGFGGAPQPQGGGFLKGALGAAAGVAGGMLLADTFRNLVGGAHAGGLGGAAGLGGLGGAGLGGTGTGAGETVVNNYYEDGKSDDDSNDDSDDNSDDAQDASDDDYSGGDDDYSGDV